MTDEQVYQAMLKETRRRTKKTLERCAARKAERDLRENWFSMLPDFVKNAVCVILGVLLGMSFGQAVVNIWCWIVR